MRPTDANPASILVFQLRGLNAFLAAVPALRAIADAFADCRRVLVAPADLRPLVELIPWPGFTPAFDLVAHPALVPLPGSLERPNLAINLHGPGPQSNAILRRLHPRRLIAYEGPTWERGPAWDPDASAVARWCALLEDARIDVDRSRTRLWRPPTDDDLRGATVIHPGGAVDGVPGPHVPAAVWAEVAGAEAAAGRTVLITGVGGDAPVAAEIAAQAGLGASSVLAGRTDAGELAGVVCGAARVVTVDGGIAPLAGALGTPSLTLYHPRFQSRLGTPRAGARHRSLILDGSAAADGDGARDHAEIAGLLTAELARLPERRFELRRPRPSPPAPVSSQGGRVPSSPGA